MGLQDYAQFLYEVIKRNTETPKQLAIVQQKLVDLDDKINHNAILFNQLIQIVQKIETISTELTQKSCVEDFSFYQHIFSSKLIIFEKKISPKIFNNINKTILWLGNKSMIPTGLKQRSRLSLINLTELPSALFDLNQRHISYDIVVVSNILLTNLLLTHSSLFIVMGRITKLTWILALPEENELDYLASFLTKQIDDTESTSQNIAKLHAAGFFEIEAIFNDGSRNITRYAREKGFYNYLSFPTEKVNLSEKRTAQFLIARKIPKYTDFDEKL